MTSAWVTATCFSPIPTKAMSRGQRQQRTRRKVKTTSQNKQQIAATEAHAVKNHKKRVYIRHGKCFTGSSTLVPPTRSI
ncbi:uncharacterized protein YALI1_A10473g [Yarrowia lipolytica]|uniref:Uncharacterized protein n=1 Tax=Yarrowia lipolytica TaxID=4952 RepID=A0A1D8N4D1_YARLL|nr:hypothetical protein YALI1_A10473g [Yarrowia lipolytica]